MIPKQKNMQKYFSDNDLASQFLYDNGIILPIVTCPEDGYSLKQISPFQFKCRKKTHRKTYSSLANTILHSSKIEPRDFLFLMYTFICEVSIKSIITMTGHSSATIGKFFKAFRSCIAAEYQLSECRIGGPGVQVQLDECKFGKRKFHRGHQVEGVWVFGGVEVTEERKMFAVPVFRRDALTLNEIILKYVRFGSIVITDGWKGYNEFKKNLNFEHHWVNHSLTFKNENGFHTNNIEGTWNGIKLKVKPQSRVKRKMEGYLFEFMWRRKHVSNLWNSFICALRP